MDEELIRFQDEKLAQAEEYFKKLQITDAQLEICDRMAQMLNLYLTTNLEALKYFMSKVLFTWQETTGKAIEYFETASPEIRLESVKFWLDELKEKYLSKILAEEVNPDTLDNAFEFAFLFYQEKYAFR